MLRVVVISINNTRLQTMRRIFPAAELFEGTTGCDKDNYREICIPKTYQRLEQKALADGWGRETVIFQDDVLLPMGAGLESYNARFDTELLVYGTSEPTGMVAPKGFSASPMVHGLLAEVWDGTARIVPAWTPIVNEHGLILNVLRNLSGRNAPCSNCP